ncbi:acyl-CoA thioesterase [Rubritalea tangerina]|uniref:Acyl-CoA thioesterase n=1 Tax=Rubritalea tangerina TaxID=430798 RepID=A0ABW4Z6J8_9BACT
MRAFSNFERRVNFADTDLAGIVHFSKILGYVEEAEHAAMLSIGVAPASESGGFPKVHVECDYRSPLRFGDVASIEMVIEKVGESSVTWTFSITLDGKLVATGKVITVYVTSMGAGSVIPDVYREALSA